MAASFVAPIVNALDSLLSEEFSLGTRLVTTAVVTTAAFFFWTWPNKLSKDIPGPGRKIPYFGEKQHAPNPFSFLSQEC